MEKCAFYLGHLGNIKNKSIKTCRQFMYGTKIDELATHILAKIKDANFWGKC